MESSLGVDLCFVLKGAQSTVRYIGAYQCRLILYCFLMGMNLKAA